MTTRVSRIFMNGNSQAVRIPQEFRLNARKVAITQTDAGDLIIHPLATDRGEALLQALAGFDDEFVALLESGQQEQEPMQDREEL